MFLIMILINDVFYSCENLTFEMLKIIECESRIMKIRSFLNSII